MHWLLKYYVKSKYFGYIRVYYKEFELFGELEHFIYEHKIKEYEIYESAGII